MLFLFIHTLHIGEKKTLLFQIVLALFCMNLWNISIVHIVAEQYLLRCTSQFAKDLILNHRMELLKIMVGVSQLVNQILMNRPLEFPIEIENKVERILLDMRVDLKFTLLYEVDGHLD